jgi:transcriptional regulator with XRE-family HTH domain
VRDTVLVQFGGRVRELRVQAGLSQEAFAHACKLDRTYVSGIERGVRNPSLKNVARIAKALKIPLTSLFESVG